MMTCVSDKSGSASMAVVRTAHTPIAATTRTPSTTKNRFLTDPRMMDAIIGQPPSSCGEPLAPTPADQS